MNRKEEKLGLVLLSLMRLNELKCSNREKKVIYATTKKRQD